MDKCITKDSKSEDEVIYVHMKQEVYNMQTDDDGLFTVEEVKSALFSSYPNKALGEYRITNYILTKNILMLSSTAYRIVIV